MSAWRAQERTFEPATFAIASKHHNFIAFRVEIALLLGVLRAARANKATQLSVRLAQKRTPVPGGAEVNATILRFVGKVGHVWFLTVNNAHSCHSQTQHFN